MGFISSVIIFGVLIIIYQVLIEVFTILYRINGVNVEISKFQVISALTGTGFTTNDSESVMMTKQRRKLTQRIMFFSYIFNISIVSTFVNIFAATQNLNEKEILFSIGIIAFIIIFFVIFHKTQIAKKFIDNIVMKIVDKKKIKKENYIFVYDIYGNKAVAEIELKSLKRNMKSKSIEEIKLKEKYHIQLLVIKRKEQNITEIYPDTKIQEGDVVLVFGKIKDIKNAFIK